MAVIVLLAVIAVAALAFGALAFMGAKSAVHEIEGLIMFLIGTVALGTAGIIETIRRCAFRWPFPPPPVQVTQPPPEQQFRWPTPSAPPAAPRPPMPGE
jgi:hypothetical protein